MMRYLPVHWSEGMFLRPQHFQAAERYWAETLHETQHWDHHYHYGLRSVEISEEALSNYEFQLVRCEARMPDGTLVVLDGGREPDRVELKEAFQRESQVTVYLAVPKLTLGHPNVGRVDDHHCRYVPQDLEVPDESRGGAEQMIQFRELNARLLLSTGELTGYEVLPIARVMRAGGAEAVPELDDSYIPPVICVEGWAPLATGIVRAIYDVIGRNIEILAARVAQRGVGLATQEPGDLEDLLRLMVLNRASASLGCLAFARGIHPLTAYTELCRIVGHLSIFDSSRRVAQIPPYDHDDLAKIFRWVRDEIYRLMQVSQLDYEMRHFVGTEHGMEVAIDAKWLDAGWNWYVGVKSPHLKEQEIRDLLRPGNLDWKMGSSQQVDMIFRFHIPGVGLEDLANAPRALPSRQGWVYYEVRKDPENSAWRDVLITKTLAVRFNRELIQNLSSLQGQRQLEVQAHGKRSALEFALFAVPEQSA